MRDLTLQTDSLQSKRPGFWPWIIGAAALIALVSSVNSDMRAIHNDLRLKSGSIVDKYTSDHASNDVTVLISGSTGSVNPNTPRDVMVRDLRNLTAVRVVSDDLVEIDLQKKALLAGQEFKQQLETINASSISFNAGSTTLASSNIPALQQLAQILKKSPDRKIKITGHTDNSGSAQANLKISQQRAQAVAQALISKGVAQQQLLVQGFGHTRPLYSNDTEAGRSKNRRIELVFMK